MNLSVHYSEMKGMIVLKDNRYIEYKKNDFLRESFGEDTVPLLLMQLLRQMDFPITRGISYERTVDDFLTQLAVNDVLRPLRKQQNLVILLDMQGALIRSEGAWELLFLNHPLSPFSWPQLPKKPSRIVQIFITVIDAP